MDAQVDPSLPAELVTVSQAAQFLGVSPKTVRRLVNDRVLPARRFGDAGYWRIDVRDLELLLVAA